MSRSYYEESRRELINRIMYLKNGNYVDFFRDSDSFILAMCIAYFGLTEDMMVKHDVKNGDIKTRLSTCIDKKYLKQQAVRPHQKKRRPHTHLRQSFVPAKSYHS